MSERSDSPSEKTPMSRRDFIRRASKDAAREVVETGSRIVPGGQAARRFLEAGKETGEGNTASFVERQKRPWWERLVMWKQERNS